jgi:hypothetical protein
MRHCLMYTSATVALQPLLLLSLLLAQLVCVAELYYAATLLSSTDNTRSHSHTDQSKHSTQLQ